MLKQLFVIIVVLGAAIFWFLSMKSERSRSTDDLVDLCEIEECKTILWAETIVRKSGWLPGVESSATMLLGEFPSYINCESARAERVMALKEQEKKQGRRVTTNTAHWSGRLVNTGSISVVVDVESGKVITRTFFCGYKTLVPDKKDHTGFLPWE
jgi:hypothetical protein